MNEWRRRGGEAIKQVKEAEGADLTDEEAAERVEGKERPYAAFTARFARAVATNRQRLLDQHARIEALVDSGDAKLVETARKAVEWRLERRYPKDFGPNQKVEVSGKDGGPVFYLPVPGSQTEAS